MSREPRYSEAEHMRMWEFLFDRLKQGDENALKPHGFAIWRDYAATIAKRNTRAGIEGRGRTENSLCTHFRRYMYHKLHDMTDLPREKMLYLYKKYSIPMDEYTKKSLQDYYNCQIHLQPNMTVADYVFIRKVEIKTPKKVIRTPPTVVKEMRDVPDETSALNDEDEPIDVNDDGRVADEQPYETPVRMSRSRVRNGRESKLDYTGQVQKTKESHRILNRPVGDISTGRLPVPTRRLYGSSIGLNSAMIKNENVDAQNQEDGQETESTLSSSPVHQKLGRRGRSDSDERSSQNASPRRRTRSGRTICLESDVSMQQHEEEQDELPDTPPPRGFPSKSSTVELSDEDEHREMNREEDPDEGTRRRSSLRRATHQKDKQNEETHRESPKSTRSLRSNAQKKEQEGLQFESVSSTASIDETDSPRSLRRARRQANEESQAQPEAEPEREREENRTIATRSKNSSSTTNRITETPRTTRQAERRKMSRGMIEWHDSSDDDEPSSTGTPQKKTRKQSEEPKKCERKRAGVSPRKSTGGRSAMVAPEEEDTDVTQQEQPPVPEQATQSSNGEDTLNTQTSSVGEMRVPGWKAHLMEFLKTQGYSPQDRFTEICVKQVMQIGAISGYQKPLREAVEIVKGVVMQREGIPPELVTAIQRPTMEELYRVLGTSDPLQTVAVPIEHPAWRYKISLDVRRAELHNVLASFNRLKPTVKTMKIAHLLRNMEHRHAAIAQTESTYLAGMEDTVTYAEKLVTKLLDEQIAAANRESLNGLSVGS